MKIRAAVLEEFAHPLEGQEVDRFALWSGSEFCSYLIDLFVLKSGRVAGTAWADNPLRALEIPLRISYRSSRMERRENLSLRRFGST